MKKIISLMCAALVMMSAAAIAQTFKPSFIGTAATNGVTVATNGAGTPYTLYLPVDDGLANQLLQTNGAGVLSWITGGTGDFSGPASSFDNALVRFDALTGKLGQNSALILEDYSTATQNKVVLRPDDGATANISLVLALKGTGALMADNPDGAVTGGNARGSNAVDFQIFRNNATEVASGGGAFIGGGGANTASGVNSVVAGGGGNDATNTYSFVGGGENNTSSGLWSAVVGGNTNSATTAEAFVGAGTSNQATGGRSGVVSGIGNVASGGQSGIVGGSGNDATDDYSFVGGGQNNQAGDAAGTTADRSHATVGGGLANTASGQYATVGGGNSNTASGLGAIVAGGGMTAVPSVGGNTASGVSSFVGAGYNASASADYSSVVGGESNTASGVSSFVGGGFNNTASGGYATIPGGRGLTLSGTHSFGYHAANAAANNISIAATNVAAFGNMDLWLVNENSTASRLRFYEPNGSAGAFPPAGVNFAALRAPALGGDYTLTLPVDDGTAGQVMTTDGAGALSWTSNASGVYGGTTAGPSNGALFAKVTGAGEGAVEADLQVPVPRTGTLANLYIFCTVAPGGGADSKTVTVRINGANSALTATITGAATTANSGALTAAVNAGDLLSVTVTHAGAPAASTVGFGFEVY